MSEDTRCKGRQSSLVCIDRCEGGILAGRLYFLPTEEHSEFQGLMQLLKELDRFFNERKFPQAFTVSRSFSTALPEETRTTASDQTSTAPGKIATFSIRVIFRQNSSWQGSVVWLNEGKEENFRSVLELVLLMDSVLCTRY